MARVGKKGTTLRGQALTAGVAAVAIWLLAVLAGYLTWKFALPNAGRLVSLSVHAKGAPSLSIALKILVWPLIFVVLSGIAVRASNLSLIFIRGHFGERRVAAELLKLPDEYWLFNDVQLQAKDKEAQIDHVLVSPYGLWCVEVKSHRGTIYGQEHDRMWTQVKKSEAGKPYRRQFYSPVRQNAVHCRRLRDYLNENVQFCPEIKSVVVFTGANLEVDAQTPVVPLEQLRRIIEGEDAEASLDQGQVEAIVKALPHDQQPRRQHQGSQS